MRQVQAVSEAVDVPLQELVGRWSKGSQEREGESPRDTKSSCLFTGHL